MKSPIFFMSVFLFLCVSRIYPQNVSDLKIKSDQQAQYIDSDTTLKVITFPCWELYDFVFELGGSVSGYFEGNRLVKIKEVRPTKDFIYFIQYYFNNNNIFLLKETNDSLIAYDLNLPIEQWKTRRESELFYYFKKRKLVSRPEHWVHWDLDRGKKDVESSILSVSKWMYKSVYERK